MADCGTNGGRAAEIRRQPIADGGETLSFFGASTNVARFSDELAPGVKTLVVGAEPGVALPLFAPEAAVA